MESPLDYYQQLQMDKKAIREIFNDDPMGCYAPVSERCKTCLEIFDEEDIIGGLCSFCHNELSNPTQ